LVNGQSSISKITAIFQPLPLLFKNGITVYSRSVPLNRYWSARIAHAWPQYMLPSSGEISYQVHCMEEKLGLVGRAGDGINSFSFVSDTLVK
jgi:hypothetical protein